MKRKVFWSICLAFGLVGASSALTNIIVYSDANDGMLEARVTLPTQPPEFAFTSGWPSVHPDTFGNWQVVVGEWYGDGLTTIVLPFELPPRSRVQNSA